MFEDIYKCSNSFEAEKLLDDPYAVEEMIRHLSERYGEIDEHFFVNYEIESILRAVGMSSKSRVGDSHLLSMKSPVEQDLEDAFEKMATPKSRRGQASS